jgi:hypothetical protein
MFRTGRPRLLIQLNATRTLRPSLSHRGDFRADKAHTGDLSMANSFLEAQIRNFNPVSVPGLTAEARDAVNAALKGMWTWRNDLVEVNEKNGKRVMEKMASAAAAMGWPEQIVDAARTQMQSIAEAHIKIMDQLMDVWEEQLKLPKSASPSAMLSKMKSMPGAAAGGNWPDADALQKAAMNPLQFWMQFAEEWQKSWAQSMRSWGDSAKMH